MSDPKLLWRLASKATLDTLRGISGGQYDIRLGRSEQIVDFFADLPQFTDYNGQRIEIATDRLLTGDGSVEIPPYELAVRRMAAESSRRDLYIRAQRPATAHPAWRPGQGPLQSTQPDTDFALLLRTADDRFYAGWLRGSVIDRLPDQVSQLIRKREVGASPITSDQLDAVLAVLVGQSTETGDPEKNVSRPSDEIEQGMVEAQEGTKVTVAHVRRERSRRLRKARIAAVEGQPVCEACGFDFRQTYGERGENFIECHHVVPLAELEPGRTTQLEDLALLCANCHRMIHAKKEWLTIDELKELLASTQR